MCKGEATGSMVGTLSDSLALNSTYAAWTSPSPMRPIVMEEAGSVIQLVLLLALLAVLSSRRHKWVEKSFFTEEGTDRPEILKYAPLPSAKPDPTRNKRLYVSRARLLPLAKSLGSLLVDLHDYS